MLGLQLTGEDLQYRRGDREKTLPNRYPGSSRRGTTGFVRKTSSLGYSDALRRDPLRGVAHIPGANIKEFLVTILGEAKRSQIQLFEPERRVLDLQ